jgi:peptidoglycan/xylan/chitin deacetylase (PgdA/CDA1 family)
MEHVARHYNPVPLERIVDWLEGGSSAPPNAVAVSFDDGFRNVLTDAAPVLERLGIPATLFVATDFVFKQEMLWPDRVISAIALTKAPHLEITSAGEARHVDLSTRAAKLRANASVIALCKSISQPQRLALLDEIEEQLHVDRTNRFSAWDGFRPLEPDELRLLPGFGITVGAHTCSHPILARLAARDQARELAESKRLIESTTSVECVEFAYPNGGPGDFSHDTRKQVIDAGYRCAFTTVKRRVTAGEDRFEIPRCTLTHNGITAAEFSAELAGWPGTIRALLNRPGARASLRAASPAPSETSTRVIA